MLAARLVADLNETPASSHPRDFVEVGNTTFFVADDGLHGRELWKTDGTASGTQLVLDIALGPEHSDPSVLTAFGNTLLFAAKSNPGETLWKSDGTPTGTVPLKTFYGVFGIDSLTPVGDTLFFSATTGVADTELWKTDGTAGGTVLVKDIGPGSQRSNPRLLTAVDDTLYFVAYEESTGLELWKSDGTEPGTSLLMDICPTTDVNSQCSNELTDLDGTLYFMAPDGMRGPALWTSDGTPEGTRIVKTIQSAGPYGQLVEITAFNGSLFFEVRGIGDGPRLWTSDGTEEGTIPLKDLDSVLDTQQLPGNRYRYQFTIAGGTLFFLADDGEHGAELWTSDGTADGTVLVKDICVECDVVTDRPDSLTSVGDTLMFWASDGQTGRRLWRSDGTEAATIPVDEATEPVSGNFYFSANVDGGTTGVELWKSDGTRDGTILVKDIRTGTEGADVAGLTESGGALYFITPTAAACTACGPPEATLWRIEGAGNRPTQFVTNRRIYPEEVVAVDGQVFFVAYKGGAVNELWKSDGTEAGTILLLQSPNYTLSPRFQHLTKSGSTLFFSSNDGVNGRELWKTDGTAAGTVLVKDILPGPDSSTPRHLTDVGGTLFFSANDGVHGWELWKSDGTEDGTVMVKDLDPLPQSSSQLVNLIDVGGTLFFFTSRGLWKSDGTEEGTVLLKESLDATSMAAVGGTLYFDGRDTEHHRELWKSDGTEEGTVLVKDIRPGVTASFPSNLTEVNGTLFFTANDGPYFDYGLEVWKSDGTEEGTVLVKDIRPGRDGSAPASFVAYDGELFFSADDGTNGVELWRTDGTAEGTVLVQDIYAGIGSSIPMSPIIVHESLYFVADNGPQGTELWVYEPDSRHLEGDFDGNGRVDQADFDLVLRDWGQDTSVLPDGWVGVPPHGVVDQDELDAVLLNWQG